MHITLVKKIKADGSPCGKCTDVERRLTAAGLIDRIDEIVLADERDPESRGMQLAARLGIAQAPFFVVRDPEGAEQVYTIYFRFIKEVLNAPASEQDIAAEIMDRNPDVGYL